MSNVSLIIEGLRESRMLVESVSWRDSVLKATSYQYSKEYQDVKTRLSACLKKRVVLHDKIEKLKKELEKEGEVKPSSEWTSDDYLESLIGNRPMIYSENGKKIKAEIENLRVESLDVEHEFSYLNDLEAKEKNLVRQREIEMNKLPAIKYTNKTKFKGFHLETGVPSFDEMIKDGKAKIAEMTPVEYLQRCAFQIFSNGTIESTLGAVRDSSVNKYASLMKSEEFDMPYLDYKRGQQEGRHRACAAIVAGIKTIPVLIIGNP